MISSRWSWWKTQKQKKENAETENFEEESVEIKNIEKENTEGENVEMNIMFFLIYDKYCILLIQKK